ncbi:MAG: tetratricopeptide repeat protein [Fibrobacteres bacterium]|nr:tetratricopeptide repeat protein [Fibrobacterota bacterium]
MTSPICTTPSRHFRAFAGPALAALLLAACAGDKPDPARPIDPALPTAQAGVEPDKGQGNLSFHYSNKSTDANLAIDLSSTDVYLEMTGKSAQEQADQLRAEAKPDPRKVAPSGHKPTTSGEDAKASEPKGDEENDDAGDAKGEKNQAPTGAQSAKGLHKGPPKKPEPPPEEDPGDYEDVTTKVLAGIRRAQELFYQKRYPEALQAARSSLDARPTAEGYGLLGSIYFMQGNTGMARRQWMEALRLNPDMPAVVNMLDKTRTPGGRGSPAPRPVYHPPARAADPDAPYPEEYSSPGAEAAPSSSVPAAPARPASSAAARPSASAPAPAATPSAAPADPAAVESAPPASAPQPEEDGDEDATVPATTAPAAAPAPAAKPAPAPSAPAKAAAKGTAAAPKGTPKAATKAAPAAAKPAQEGTR